MLVHEKPHLAPLTIIPATPPPIYSPTLTSSPTTCFPSPSTSTLTSSSGTRDTMPLSISPRTREIVMGGLVSRPSTPRRPSSLEYRDGPDEKRQASIEVPGIVLTEPLPDLSPRTPSPPPKSILLLPPVSLPLPLEPHTASSYTPLSQILRQCGVGTVTMRSVIILGALALGAWHLYTTLNSDLFDEVIVETL